MIFFLRPTNDTMWEVDKNHIDLWMIQTLYFGECSTKTTYQMLNLVLFYLC